MIPSLSSDTNKAQTTKATTHATESDWLTRAVIWGTSPVMLLMAVLASFPGSLEPGKEANGSLYMPWAWSFKEILWPWRLGRLGCHCKWPFHSAHHIWGWFFLQGSKLVKGTCYVMYINWQPLWLVYSKTELSTAYLPIPLHNWAAKAW